MNRRNITSNMIWRFLERTGAQGVTLVVSIVLARILEPSIYGTVAIVLVFTRILQVFIDGGLGNSLIQKKDAYDLDFSTVFYFNIVFCLILYWILFFIAPFISSFYNMPELTALLRVLGLTVVISSVKNIQQAYVFRHLLFRKFFFSTLAGTVGAGIVGIWMAYQGYGVWALIAQYLFNAMIDTIVLWLTVKWRPKLCFSFEKLKGLWSYGWKLLVSGLIDRAYMELRTFIIGKVYATSTLAFYERGRQFPNVIVANINTAIDSALFPSMSSVQDDKERVKNMTRRAIKTSTYIMAFLMMCLAACATPLVSILLTEKWLPCVFFLRIFCFTYMFYPIHTANLNAIKALGRSDLFLKLEIIKKIVGLIFLFSTIFISVEIMAISGIFSSVISQIINAWPNKKLLGYSYIEQLKDILPGISLAVIMAIVIFPIQYINYLPDILILLIQLLLGAVIFICGSKFLHLDSFEYIIGILKSYRKK